MPLIFLLGHASTIAAAGVDADLPLTFLIVQGQRGDDSNRSLPPSPSLQLTRAYSPIGTDLARVWVSPRGARILQGGVMNALAYNVVAIVDGAASRNLLNGVRVTEGPTEADTIPAFSLARTLWSVGTADA